MHALNELREPWEIVAVNDGSTDSTREVLARLVDTVEGASSSLMKVVELDRNGGKFAALIAGMAAASGECRLFMDADLPFDLSGIANFRDLILCDGFDIAIGDRTLAHSRSIGDSTAIRRVAHLLFSQLVRIVSLGGYADSQCGIKAYRAAVAEALFPLLRERRFAGDIEHLYIALKYNLAITKVPVTQLEHGASTVSVIPAAIEILRTMFLLPIRWRIGCYASATMLSLAINRPRAHPSASKN